jgi:hypothetical protein
MEETITLKEMVDSAAADIQGSHFAPRQTGKATFNFGSLLWGLLQGFVQKCWGGNAAAAKKKLLKQASKAAAGKENIRAPRWAYDAAADAGMKTEAQQESAIHATLLWAGNFPDKAGATIEAFRNDQDRLGDAFRSPYSRAAPSPEDAAAGDDDDDSPVDEE